MIGLKKLKSQQRHQQQQQVNHNNKKNVHHHHHGHDLHPAYLRVTKELKDLRLSPVDFSESDSLRFHITIRPTAGYYANGSFKFGFEIGKNYPFDPPVVKSLTKMYHPNIDYEGNVDLIILGQDWLPVLTLNSVVDGLIHLLVEPNLNDPLNHVAAYELIHQPELFAQHVEIAKYGGAIRCEYFLGCQP